MSGTSGLGGIGATPGSLAGGGTAASNLLMSDSFTDTDAVTLPNHTPTYRHDSVTASWVDNDVGITIESNKASDNDVTGASTIDVGNANVTLAVTMIIQGGGNGFNGLAFRLQDATHFWIDGCDVVNDKVTIWENNGGVWAERGGNANGSFNFTAGETRTISITVNGTSISVSIDDVVSATATSAVFQTETKHGLYNDAVAGGTDATWDELSIRTV